MSEINNKEILYKIYTNAGVFITTLTNVVSDLSIKYTINSSLSNLTLRLATKESSFAENSVIKQGNRIKIFVFDTDSGTSGVCIYSGLLVSYTPSIVGGEEYVDVEFYSHFWDLENKIMLSEAGKEANQSFIADYEELKAYYRFETGALTTDSSGNAHTLTAVSDPAEATGKFGGGVLLDANDAYTLPDHEHFRPTGSFTIGAYFKLTDATVWRTIFHSRINASSKWAGIVLDIEATTGKIHFFSMRDTGDVEGVDYGAIESASAVNDGNWHLAIVGWDGAYLRMWIDGVAETPVAWGYAPAYQATNYVCVGCDRSISPYAPAFFFGGTLDEVFLLNGVCLTDEDVDAHISGGSTTIKYNSYDPSNIMKDILDKYNSLYSGILTYDASSIDLTGTAVSYTFNTNTFQEGIKKILELCPEDWFFRVEADDKIYLELMEATPSHYFTIGKDIMEYKPEKRFDNIVNTIYFRGKDTFYKKYTNTSSVSAYGVRAITMSDQRVSVEATADLIANKILDEKSSPEIRVVIKVMDNNGEAGEMGYDIESIKVGQTCNILNATSKAENLWDESSWDINSWDYDITNASAVPLQIASIEYTPDYVVLELSNRQPDISKRVEDINRNLKDTIASSNPSAPIE